MEETLWTVVSRTVHQSGSIERAVFFLLVALSLASWTIIFWKLCALYEVRRNGQRFMAVFEGADCFGSVAAGGQAAGPSPLFAIFQRAVSVMEKMQPAAAKPLAVVDPRQVQLHPANTPEEMMVVAMQQTAQGEFQRLQYGLGFLATVGSTSPFIGLFGTVWGIMNTFRDLGSAKSASLAVVAPGISSALIATAAGLAVAIPAVMAYNWLLAELDRLQDRSDSFINRVTVLVRASGYFNGHAAAQVQTPARVAPHGAILQQKDVETGVART